MAGNSFGGSIKLSGESEYRKALKDITGDMRLMSSEMKVMATNTANGGKASDADKAKKEALSKAINEQREKLVALGKALQESNAKNGENSDSSKRLQTQINNSTAQLNKMESQLNSTGNEMDGTGKKASVFGDVLKANLASEAIVAGVKKIGQAIQAIGAVVVGMVKDSVKAFADYEQLIGGVETLFKKSAPAIEEYANTAYKTAGLSANAYMETVTSFSASLLQGLDGDTKKASEVANRAVTDMSDNANKMGTDIGLIQTAYQGFAKDNFTMLDNLKLGYGGTASEMARLVNDSGVMGKEFKATAENVKDIPFDQLIKAIGKTQDELGITGTTAKEASSTISGSFNSVKASWENVLASFAGGDNDAIQEAIDGLMEGVTNLATNVTAILPNIVEGIGQLAQGLLEQIPKLLETILPVLINALTGLVQTIITIIPQLVPVVVQLITQLANIILQNLPLLLQAGITIIVGLITGIAQALPTMIPQIVEAVVLVVDTLVQNLPLLIEAGITLLIALIQGIAKALPQLIKAIPKIIDTLITTLTKPEMLSMLIKASLTLVVEIAKGLIQAIPELIKAIPKIITSIVKGLAQGVKSMLTVGKDLVEGLWNGISNATSWIMDKIKGFGESILNGIKGFFGIKSPSRLFRDEVGKNLALGVGEGFSTSMKDVTKSMQKALPSSLDTDIALNTNGLSATVAESNRLASETSSENLVGAISRALSGAKVIMDDKVMGNFVIETVEGAVY